MLSRILCISLALATLITSGCRTRSNYQPSCPPAVVAAAPVPCPTPCPNPPPVAPVPPPPFGR